MQIVDPEFKIYAHSLLGQDVSMWQANELGYGSGKSTLAERKEGAKAQGYGSFPGFRKLANI